MIHTINWFIFLNVLHICHLQCITLPPPCLDPYHLFLDYSVGLPPDLAATAHSTLHAARLSFMWSHHALAHTMPMITTLQDKFKFLILAPPHIGTNIHKFSWVSYVNHLLPSNQAFSYLHMFHFHNFPQGMPRMQLHLLHKVNSKNTNLRLLTLLNSYSIYCWLHSLNN